LKHIHEKRKSEVEKMVQNLWKLRHYNTLKAEASQIDYIYESITELQMKGLLPPIDIDYEHTTDTT
jgi:hypothetical protein